MATEITKREEINLEDVKGMDWTEEFTNLVRNGFVLQKDSWRYLYDCIWEADESMRSNEMVLVAHDSPPNRYFLLREQVEGGLGVTCYRYACWLTEYGRGVVSVAQKVQEWCNQFFPGGRGEWMATHLERLIERFSKSYEFSELWVECYRQACKDGEPTNLMRRVVELDLELSSYEDDIDLDEIMKRKWEGNECI